MRSPAYTISLTHIDLIQPGDFVELDGELRTVGRGDLRTGTFMGTTLWGDSYRLGTVLVKKALIHHTKPALKEVA